jgi:hypothetical protein
LTFEGNGAEIALYDLKGSEVFRASVYASGEVSFAGVSPGIYSVVVRTEKGVAHQERLTIVD